MLERAVRWLLCLGLLTGALALAAPAAAGTPGSRGLAPRAQMFVPPPSPGALPQAIDLLRAGDVADARLLFAMEATPRAVWFDGGTPQQVGEQVRRTIWQAARERSVPVLVAYDIPGRDCAQYSAGGALTLAAYEAWIQAFARGIGARRAVVILEPDSLGLLPSSCGGPSSSYPFTDSDRFAELQYAVSALEAQPRTSVYMDGTHSSWLAVGDITHRLLEAGVVNAQGFFVNVSNYQPTPQLVDYGTWISDCIAMVSDSSNPDYNNPSACASQYYPATPSDFSTWGLTTQWYAQHMGTAVASTHFVIDTSRNGRGPADMTTYARAPYNQPASVINALQAGSWCNPPGRGLGLRPTSDTDVPLLDAYLWVKTPGQSDGQCDSAGGARAWDYSAYTQPGWPTDPGQQAQFDPLWGQVDPPAGGWFPQQALQLAQLANPPLDTPTLVRRRHGVR